MYLLLCWVAGAAGTIGKGNRGGVGRDTSVCLPCSARASHKEGTTLKSWVPVSHGKACPWDKEGVKWGSQELPWNSRQALHKAKKIFLKKQ